jgi:hypothetical protein
MTTPSLIHLYWKILSEKVEIMREKEEGEKKKDSMEMSLNFKSFEN